jgi:predicted HicB family RNase H-like nuclease
VDILKYKEYEGTAELVMVRGVCRGKILFINDLVTYEAALPSELQKEFEAAVDDYIETCVALGREPQKPLKGQFNVRIPPSLHKDATLRAYKDNATLNDVMVRALDTYINTPVNINHETKNYFVGVGEFKEAFAMASDQDTRKLIYGADVMVGSAIAVMSDIGSTKYAKGGKHGVIRH